MATTHPPVGRAPTRPPDLTTFTVVHRGLRRDGARLASAIDGLGLGDTARARAVQRWFGGFHDELDGHHAIEEQLWFPVLAERVPTFAQHTDRIEREHDLLDDATRGVTRALDTLVDHEVSPGTRARAHEAACELSSILDLHLGFEDADILPLFVRHFSDDEYDEVERRTRKLLTLRQLPFTVPWLMSATTPSERDRLLERAPLALKLVWVASRGRYARLTARALGPAAKGVA